MNPTHLAATVLAAALMFAACAPDPVIGSGELQGEPTSVPDAEREPAQEPAAPLSTPTPVPPPTPAPSPTPQPPIPTPTPQPPTVSDEVPSVQELLDLGLTEGQTTPEW